MNDEEPYSWLQSCWEADLQANKDNPDPIVQHVMESFRKYLQMTDRERDQWARELLQQKGNVLS